jgi:hypothetical protein
MTAPRFSRDGTKYHEATAAQGWLLSAGDSAGETYQYEDGGRYTLIRREVSTWDREKHTVTTENYELRNGKMELVDSKTTPF